MAARVSARLSRGDGRRFGLTVGVAFLALAAVARWRGHATSFAVLAALGTALVIAGLVVPQRLGIVEAAWMRLAVGISRVTTPILMGVIYYGLFTPLGAVLRAFGRRPLARDVAAGTYWVPHRSLADGQGGMERQF